MSNHSIEKPNLNSPSECPLPRWQLDETGQASRPIIPTKTILKAEIDAEAWATLNSDTSRPSDKPKTGRIALKVINHLGDEVMKVFKT